MWICIWPIKIGTKDKSRKNYQKKKKTKAEKRKEEKKNCLERLCRLNDIDGKKRTIPTQNSGNNLDY